MTGGTERYLRRLPASGQGAEKSVISEIPTYPARRTPRPLPRTSVAGGPLPPTRDHSLLRRTRTALLQHAMCWRSERYDKQDLVMSAGPTLRHETSRSPGHRVPLSVCGRAAPARRGFADVPVKVRTSNGE